MSLEEELKNDFVMEENSVIEALQSMNFTSDELDGYDLIDFSLLDDGYSEIPEENKFIMEEQAVENAAQESIYESTVPFEEMKKSDIFLHSEIIEALSTVYGSKRFIHQVADGFYDLEAKHNGLVALWSIEETRRKNVAVNSQKNIVNSLLGTHNTKSVIEGAICPQNFVPILNVSKRVFEKYAGSSEGTHVSTDSVFPLFTMYENYGTMREHLKNGEDNAYKTVDTYGINGTNGAPVSFSDNRIFNSMLFDTDVMLVNSYEAYQMFEDYSMNSHRVSNIINRLIYEPSSSRNSVVFDKDVVLEAEKKNVVGFVQKLGNKKYTNVYNLNIRELDNVVINRKHKGSNAYVFSDVVDIETYGKLMDFIVPSINDLLQNNTILSLEKFNKKIKQYDYSLSNISISSFDELRNKLTQALNKEYKNKFSNLKYTKLAKKFLIPNYEQTLLFNNERLEFLQRYYGDYKQEFKTSDNALMRLAWFLSRSDNGVLLVDINSEKARREVNSLNTREKQKLYAIYSKYFIFQKQSIRDKIMLSTTDEVQQKELFKKYVVSHGTISKMSHSVVDGQGGFICCTHTYDLLLDNIDNEGLLINYGLHYRGGYMCKYCGEHIHTDYDEGPSFDDDGNVIVSHGQIEVDETDDSEKINIDDDTSEFIKVMLNAFVTVASLKYKEMNINKNNLLKIFLKNMKLHTAVKPELNNVFSYDTVKNELNSEKNNIVRALEKKVGKGKLNIEKIRTEINSTYIMSMVCYKVAVFASVFMLQLQLNNPQLFGENEAYIKSFSSIIKQQIMLDTIAKYVSDNIYEKFQGDYNYIDLILKKNIVPVGPFSSASRMTKNFTVLESVMEDNYKKLLKSEAVDIILAKHSLKNSNVTVMQKDVNHYGSVQVPQTSISEKGDHYNVKILASNYAKTVNRAYKEFVQEPSITDYTAALRLSVDISSKLDNNEPRKEFKETKFQNGVNKELMLLVDGIDKYKKFLDKKSSSYKNTFVKNIRNDVVPFNVNPQLKSKGVLKPFPIARKLAVKQPVNETTECRGDKTILENISVVVDFISKNMVFDSSEVKEYQFVKYWYNNEVFNMDEFTKLYSMDVINMSSKKISELENEILFSDSMKNRKYSNYYLKNQYQGIDNTIRNAMNSFLQNYLRQTIGLYSKEPSVPENDDEETRFAMEDLGFKSYEVLQAIQDESLQCLMMREMAHNTNVMSEAGLQFKYSLLLLKISYEIMLNIKTRNTTTLESEALHYESKRKQYVNMKNAKERNNVDENVMEGMESTEGMEDMEGIGEQQEGTDDIPVDIIEDSDGNYASM